MHVLAFAVDDFRQWLPASTWSAILFLDLLLKLAIGLRVIMQRRPTGETLAWIMVVFSMPIIGPLLYLTMGELRLGRRRAGRFTELTKPLMDWLHDIRQRSLVDWNSLEADYKPLAEMCERTVGVPALAGNRVDLLADWEQIFAKLLADVEAAASTIHVEFYIWSDGGEADRVADALIHAQRRGVTCRVLVDALGSHHFLHGKVCKRMRAGGVHVVAALPGGLFRLPFVRFDLRLHRKIVVIDGRVGYTGSLNLVDPRYFKKNAGVGEWVDAMVRVEGPAVEAMQIIFLADWYVESHAELDHLLETADAKPQPPRGDVETQVMPSGPDLPANAIEQVLLTAIYSARHELLITTPYFVPSEPLTLALVAAARRGVKVVLILPRRVDSTLVRYASSAFKGDLLEAGVRIALFNDGLLHTKSVTVDREHSLFGSVNLDPRSFRLNFEILLAMYDSHFTTQLADLQQTYIDRSELMDLETYRRRPLHHKVLESFARLLGPLL
ncbi:MAG: cardiolipin synthase [Pirellulales bacterium]